MTTCEKQAGFTLLEVIVVLAVLGLLLGTAVPLAGAVVQADRRQEAARELAAIGEALESYWFEHAAFPATLTATGFYGVHLQTGVGGTVIQDPFGAGQDYRYSVSVGAGTATVYSIGENGVDDGVTNEEQVLVVSGSVPGARRTHQRLRVIVEVLADHIESGGSTTGSWSTLCTSLGLGNEYLTDGWGTTLQWTAATHSLASAGPDRTFGTADDITL